MTENKRFHFGYVLGDTGLIDEQSTEHKWFIENCCSVSDLKKNWKTVCDKLNEVAEENEQLKQSNERIVKDIDLALGFIRHKGYSLQDIKDYEDAKKEYEEDLAYYRNGDVE